MKGRAALFGLAALIALAAVVAVRGWLARNPPPAAEAPSPVAVESASTQASEVAAEAATAPPIERAREPTSEAESATREPLTVCVVDDATSRSVVGARVTAYDTAALARALDAAGATMDTPAGRVLRHSIEVAAFTESDGCAEIDVPAGRAVLEARAGELWAIEFVGVVPADRRVTLRLGPDRVLRVRVTDGAENPVARVPVALRRATHATPRYTWKSTETEPPDGVATFEHFQRRLAQGHGWHAVLAFPTLDAPEAPVDASTPLEPPTTLALPPTGGLVIHVRDGHGAVPRLDGIDLRLHAFAASGGEEVWPDGPWSEPRIDPSGDAHVPWIGLGLSVRADLRRDDDLLASTETAGPTRAGEIVEVDLVWDDTAPPPFAVTGRFVFADGTPWPRAEVEATEVLFPWPDTAPEPSTFDVGDDGRFHLALREPRAGDGARSVRFSAEHPRARGRVYALVPIERDVPAEGLELGDVVLDHGPLLAAGLVVDEAGAAIAGARVWLHSHAIVQGQEFWPRVQASGLGVTGADGAFELHLQGGERLSGSALRLRTECKGYVTDPDHAIARGETGVAVVLRRAGAIEGSLVLDPELAARDVLLALEGKAKFATNLRDDLGFRFGELEAGEYSLEVHVRALDGSFETFTRIDGLIVRSGETCRDPRIQGLRVESACESVAITVVDRASSPIAGALVSPAGARGQLGMSTGADGVCRVRAQRLPIDLEVTAFGYRRRRVTGIDADTRVVLEDGIAVRIRAGVPSHGASPEYHLGVHLFEVDERGVLGGLVYGESFPVQRRFFDARGEIVLRLPSPGAYDCTPWVYVPRDGVGTGGGVAVDPIPRLTVIESAVEQVFDLAIPQSAVDATVARALE